MRVAEGADGYRSSRIATLLARSRSGCSLQAIAQAS